MSKWNRALLSFVCLVWLFPLALLTLGSFTSEQAIVDHQSLWTLTTENFRALFTQSEVVLGLRNSLLVAVAATIISATIAAPAAYAAAQKPLALRGVFGWILTTRILPPAAILVPLFVVVQTVQATNSLFAVAVILGASNVPLAAWLMRQFIVDIPGNLMDALRVDGGGEWALIRWLIVPIAGSGFAAALFLSFVLAWNDYLFASVLIASPDLKTLPVIAADFVTGYKIKWGLMLACDVVLIIPPVILSVIAAPQIARIVLRATKN